MSPFRESRRIIVAVASLTSVQSSTYMPRLVCTAQIIIDVSWKEGEVYGQLYVYAKLTSTASGARVELQLHDIHGRYILKAVSRLKAKRRESR